MGLSVEIAALTVLFFAAALVYASVGFGGGSAYLALLTLWDVPLVEVAVVALACNVIVVTGGSWHFVRAGHFSARWALPFLVTAIPAAYLGGRYRVDIEVLQVLTALGLAAAALAMFFGRREGSTVDECVSPATRWGSGVLLGSALGGLSGLIGIGGGVFLAPVLHLLRWGTAKQIAATASLFILLNSLAGLAGKMAWVAVSSAVLAHAPLFVAVLIGGQIGSRLGARRLPPLVVKRVTAGIVLLAAVSLLL